MPLVGNQSRKRLAQASTISAELPWNRATAYFPPGIVVLRFFPALTKSVGTSTHASYRHFAAAEILGGEARIHPGNLRRQLLGGWIEHGLGVDGRCRGEVGNSPSLGRANL